MLELGRRTPEPVMSRPFGCCSEHSRLPPVAIANHPTFNTALFVPYAKHLIFKCLPAEALL